MLKRIVVLLLLVAGSGYAVAAQKLRLFSGVEQAFKQKEPAWKVENIQAGQTQDPVKESIVFRQGARQASIDISIWRRLQDARDVFAGQVIVNDNLRGKSAPKRRLANLGDENYMWANPHGSWPLIQFRHGSVEVTVFAPTVTVAERFARLVLDEISHTQ
jgi:hypothetical protein